jgi:threonine-phosphate decarboxylase
MDIHDYAESKRLSLRQILDFTSSVNPLGPSNKAKNAIRKSIKFLEFPPDEKIRYLKRYICKQERIEEGCIVFGQGSSSLLHSLLKATEPKTILLVSPVSKRYRDILNNYRMDIQLFPVEEKCPPQFSIDITGLIDRLKTVDMIILPNPHDVTGTIMPAENLGSLIEATEKTGKILVIDERYMDFAPYRSFVKLVTESQNTLILRTFSVFHALKGLPLGYGAGSPALMKKLNDNLIPPPQGNALVYAAAIVSLKDKGHKTRTMKLVKEEKKYFIEKLKQIDGLQIFDTACNFLLLKIERQIPDLASLFIKYHIIIDEYSSESVNTYLKVPLKRHKLNAQFIKTLKNILKT